ncbi:MAG: ABC transporter ATP-binding protein, partial [Clostridia bacterium]|nr:ABC transporter ATP-binding protein [Clostridia bacterium]
EVKERGCTAVITSHSLRELEDTCTQLALLHQGGLIFQSETDKLTHDLFKVQFSRAEPFDEGLFAGLRVLEFKKQGSVANMIIRGDQVAVLEQLMVFQPALLEVLPLSLEEVCVHEMAALGYAFAGI